MCGETKVVIEQKVRLLSTSKVTFASREVLSAFCPLIAWLLQPQMLSGKKMGVGAVSWDSSFVLASYLACILSSYPP